MSLRGGLGQLGNTTLVFHVLVTSPMVMVCEEGQFGRAFLCGCLEVVVLRGSQRRSSLALVLELEPPLALEYVANLVRLAEAELRHVPRG